MVEAFATALNTRLLYFIPRDNGVQRAELRRKTVIEAAPDSAQAEEYRALARVVEENSRFSVLTPLPGDALEALLINYGFFEE